MTALNVIVNCSCGNQHISKDYSLFLTYPMFPGENLTSLALATKTSSKLIQMYNPGDNFSAGTGLLYIPTRDKFGNYPPMPTGDLSDGALAGFLGIAVDKSTEFSYKELAQ
ncbi:hypothetical protein RDI58_002672 [Solanum bulbocastanum]|uniref:LYK3/RLK10-like LysM domain-containing protein n=1 Tax=Solanum bulbocastanum TaxID=147425 RepID=A0AAN8UBV2_SOLBU